MLDRNILSTERPHQTKHRLDPRYKVTNFHLFTFSPFFPLFFFQSPPSPSFPAQVLLHHSKASHHCEKHKAKNKPLFFRFNNRQINRVFETKKVCIKKNPFRIHIKCIPTSPTMTVSSMKDVLQSIGTIPKIDE